MHRHRRLAHSIAIPLALVIAVVAAGPALARDMSISKSDGVVAQLVWGEGDPASPTQSWGNLAAFGQGDSTMIWFNDTQVQMLTCDAGTPDPTDDYEGYRGTARVGDGVGTSTVARDLRSASASGVITIYTIAFDDCAGVWDVVDVEEDVAVSFDIRASGRSEHWVDVYRERAPGEYDARQVSRMRGYHASGSAALGGVPLDFADALIARFSSMSQWRSR